MTLRHPLRRWLTTVVVVAATTVTVLTGTAAAAPATDPVRSPDRATSDTADFTPRDLRGRWVSDTCETVAPDGSVFGTRDFLFRGNSWSIVFRAFGDAACTVPLFSTEVSGRYELLGPSVENPAAQDADFGRRDITFTALQPGIAAAAEAAGCGEGPWEVGVLQDITEGGCAALGTEDPVECTEELDLLSLEASGDGKGIGDRLKFGERVDLCDERAPALRDQDVVRVSRIPVRTT